MPSAPREVSLLVLKAVVISLRVKGVSFSDSSSQALVISCVLSCLNSSRVSLVAWGRFVVDVRPVGTQFTQLSILPKRLVYKWVSRKTWGR